MRILGVVGLVQLRLAVLVGDNGQLAKIALAVNVDAASADRPLGVGVEPLQDRLDERIVQGIVIGIEEEVTLRHLEADTGCVLGFHGGNSLIVGDPGVRPFGGCTCGAAVSREGNLGLLTGLA